MIKKYKAISYAAEAVEWDGNNLDEIKEWIGDKGTVGCYNRCLFVSFDNANSLMPNTGDMIYKTNRGQFGVMTKKQFAEYYEEVK